MRSLGISRLLWKQPEQVAQADSLRLEFLAGYQPAPPAHAVSTTIRKSPLALGD